MIKQKFKSPVRTVFAALRKVLAGTFLMLFPAPSGISQKSSIMQDSLKRNFIIHTPAFFKHGKLPLLLALHGRGGNSESMVLITRSGFNKLSDKEGFVVVYPDGIEMNWNDGRMDEEVDDRAHSENIDDVGFISSLIDLMVKDYNVDPKRVYVTGISNGAIMSYRLACELSDKITAIAPVDGNIPSMILDGCSPSQPVSVLAINNVNDPLVPFEGGEIYGHFHTTKLGKVLSANESIQFWVKRNKCSTHAVEVEEPDRDPHDGTTVKRQVYWDGLKGTEVILYIVYGGGHTWPGGFQYLPAWVIGKTSREFDANEVIWEFFSRHARE
jgi:polyhydroxybutyrate depolymerase